LKGNKLNLQSLKPKHFLWEVVDSVATVTLNRPEKKNPLTFESYAELRDTFLSLKEDRTIKSVVITGAGENFCSGGDVHEIIGKLVDMSDKDLLNFTQMTGDLIKAIMTAPQPVIAAVDGVCVGAGACVSMASDIRFGTKRSKTAFLFVRVGLAGCDMGACAILPRIIGHGRAAELFYSGRSFSGDEGYQNGFYNRLVEPETLLSEAKIFAQELACGPTAAHALTKEMLRREWDMPVIDAISEEAVAQANCMQTKDFRRAYEAIIKKQKPVYQGN
jgi:enoyl-CoA hydratase/carnithine racemase